MRGRLIYLASPYSHSDPAVQEARFLAVCAHVADMMRQGEHVYSPVCHTHPVTRFGLPGDWEYWAEYDKVMLSRCDELAVLCLDGWRESVGVRAEIAIAKEAGMPVRFIECRKHAPAEAET
jgi:hypothetical protein